jgi:hypothetical protein
MVSATPFTQAGLAGLRQNKFKLNMLVTGGNVDQVDTLIVCTRSTTPTASKTVAGLWQG